MKKNFFALIVFLFQLSAQAGDFFLTTNDLWFDAQDRTRVSGLIETQHIYRDKADAILQANLPESIYKKITIWRLSPDGMILQIQLPKMTHAELIQIKAVIPQLARSGAESLSPELPLAVRIHNLKDQDKFLAKVSGLPLKTIRKIDKAVEENKRTGKPIVIRYFLDNRKKSDPEDYAELKPFYKGTIITHIPANTYGSMPLYVPENSVVFHSRSFHGKTILGRINPGLVNSNIAQALTANKYVEALFWKQYAPEALPETHLLSLMGLDLNNVAKMVSQLNQRFPEGWVMKGVNESSSNFSIITDKTNLVKEIEDYRNSDFEAFKAKTYKDMAGYDEDNIYEALQEHKNYFGWRASLYLKNADNVIVQRKVDIDREFRVEAIGGRILKGATIDRHNWLLELKGLPFTVSSPELIARIEDYTQTLVDKLPPELRETNFAFDIAHLKNGKFIAIESNAGSESGFLTNQDTSAEALNKFMKQYPDLKNKGEVLARGLSEKEQMKYLKTRFKAWNIDVAVHYPTYKFTSTEVDVGFKPAEGAEDYRLSGNGLSCRQILE